MLRLRERPTAGPIAGPAADPIDEPFAQRFAADWIAAWNAHDLDRVLAHYADDFEMSSPLIAQIAGKPSGTLRGKPAVRAYWALALRHIPDLEFELLCVLTGVSSVTLFYVGAQARLAGEVFQFGSDRKVRKAFAHYQA
jgi:ketosteroid isomerase-like protein